MKDFDFVETFVFRPYLVELALHHTQGIDILKQLPFSDSLEKVNNLDARKGLDQGGVAESLQRELLRTD